jgi:predicted metal-dependent hydrolase
MKINVSARARRLRIVVRPGGEVEATLPLGMPRAMLDRFLANKSAWIAGAVNRMKKVAPKVALPRVQYKAVRKQAETFVRQRTRELNQIYGFEYRRITIRNQRTRWGSCSRKGNLSFNYRIILLPPELADYVIVHELCHLQEMNHSKNFWVLVAKVVPNPKKVRRALRRYSLRAS